GELSRGQHPGELCGAVLLQDRVGDGRELMQSLGGGVVRYAFGQTGVQEEQAGREPERKLPCRGAPCRSRCHVGSPHEVVAPAYQTRSRARPVKRTRPAAPSRSEERRVGKEKCNQRPSNIHKLQWHTHTSCWSG